MNKEEIIDFLDALRCWDLKGILKYSDLQVTNEDLTCIETTTGTNCLSLPMILLISTCVCLF